MQTKNKINLLRISFWTGAVIDGIYAIAMLFPNFWQSFMGLNVLDSMPAFNYALWIGATLIFGWTALLIWADRKPLERKGVLAITIFPIIFGLISDNAYAWTSGLINSTTFISKVILFSSLTALFLFSYLNARNVDIKYQSG